MPVTLDDRFTEPPTQAGLLLDGAVANVFTVTLVEPVAEQPSPTAEIGRAHV